MISDTPEPESPEPAPIDKARRKFALGLFGAISLVGFTGMTLAVVSDTTPQEPLFTMGASANNTTKDAQTSLAPAYLDPNTYVYKAADSLTLDADTAHIYRLVRTGDPEDRVRALAEIFNLNGDISQVSAGGPDQIIYEIRDEQPAGDGSVLSLYWSGPGSWNYSRFTSGVSVGCASPTESTPSEPGKTPTTEKPNPLPPDVAVDPCVLPTPPDPSVFPDEETAKQQARTIFARSGLAVSDADLTYLNTGWDVSVRASMRVAGEPIALDWTVAWDQTGEISWASGYSVRAEDAGMFNTVSDKQAVSRISDGRWFGAPASAPWWSELRPMATTGMGGEAQAEPPVAAVDSVVVGQTDPGSAPAPTPLEEPGDDPLPSPNPTPRIVYITITHSERGSLVAYDSNGDAWVVPGYLLSDGTRAQWSVISLAEGVIELAAPIQAIPMLEGAPGEPAMK